MFPDTWHTSTFKHKEGKILQEYVQQAYLEVGKKIHCETQTQNLN